MKPVFEASGVKGKVAWALAERVLRAMAISPVETVISAIRWWL